MCPPISGLVSTPRRANSAPSVERVTDRVVRFTEQFFDRLADLLDEDRGIDGAPSITDFLLLDLPAVRDALANDYHNVTLPTADPDVRVYLSAGVLVRRFAVYVAVELDGSVEGFWIDFDGLGSADAIA
jgi:hypothetical protein